MFIREMKPDLLLQDGAISIKKGEKAVYSSIHRFPLPLGAACPLLPPLLPLP